MAKNKPDPNEWVTNESRGPNIIRKKKIGGKGESSIYEWGLPPDKIPGNTPNIQWSKAAAIKNLGYDPNEVKTLQKLLIQRLQTRLDEIRDIKFKVVKQKLGTTDKKKLAEILKKSDYDASRVFVNLSTEGKALRRALGSMFTTDPDFFAERGVWELLTTNLDRLEGEELFRVVKGLDASISGSKGGLVGHHTSLSASTSLLEKVDEKWRAEYNKIVKDSGVDLGERSLKRVEGLAHKPVLIKGKQTLKGYIAKTLAPLMPEVPFKNDELVVPRGKYPKIDTWLDKMGEISAHGKEYAGTVGFSVDDALSRMTPQKAFDNARNIYDAELAIQQQAKILNSNLNKVFNKDFPKKNFKNIDDAADFLIKKANQENWQPATVKSNVIAEAKGNLGQTSSLERRGIDKRSETDRLKSGQTLVLDEDALNQKPYSLDTDSTWFKKGLFSTAALTGVSLWNSTKTLAGALVDPRDLLHPDITTNIAQYQNRTEAGENPWTVAKEEGAESVGVIKDELLKAGGLITGLKIASKIPKVSTVVQGGTAILGAPVLMKGLFAGAVYGGINAYLKERTGRSLNERVMMDTGYADLLKTNRVVRQEVDDEGVSREVVTYEKDPDLEKEKWDKLRTYFENRNKSN